MPGSVLPATFGNPAASLGFVGFVRFGGSVGGAADQGLVRATSCDLRLMQDVTAPDVVDSTFDKTVWQLGPKLVEGTVEFPAIFARDSAGNTIAETLFDLAVQRDSSGKLQIIPISVKYTSSNAAFDYSSCIVDSYTFSVTQSDVISISVSIIGGGRTDNETLVDPGQEIKNTRIVTWNDAVVKLSLIGNSAAEIGGEFVRSFEMTLANNADRFYTLNGALAPQDIAPTKREVTGTVVLMGRHPGLGIHAADNEERCFDDSTIQFGYDIGSLEDNCGGAFIRTLPSVVFQIEEIALTNDLFESTVNFQSFPAANLPTSDPLLT